MNSLTSRIDNETFVTVAADADSLLGDTGISGHGVSRCRPDDVYDDEIGEGIALGRAIQDFGRNVERAFIARTVSTEEFNRVLALFPVEAVVGLALGALGSPESDGRQTAGDALAAGLLVHQAVGA